MSDSRRFKLMCCSAGFNNASAGLTYVGRTKASAQLSPYSLLQVKCRTQSAGLTYVGLLKPSLVLVPNLHFQFKNAVTAERIRRYSKPTQARKLSYVTDMVELELRRVLDTKFKSESYFWSESAWEDFIYDQIAYFSSAFDFSHGLRNEFNRPPSSSHPEYLTASPKPLHLSVIANLN